MCAHLSVRFRSADIVAGRLTAESQDCGRGGDVEVPHLHDCASVMFVAHATLTSPLRIYQINGEIINPAPGACMAVPFTFFFFLHHEPSSVVGRLLHVAYGEAV